jgi:hypothetical protein
VKATMLETVLALLAAGLAYRGLRRLAGVALLAALLTGGVAIADRHGVDVDDLRRVVLCETQAIARAATRLHDPASSSSRHDSARTRGALLRVGGCHPQSAAATARQRVGARR